MVPTISQQLRGVRAALAKAVVPSLPADDSFAQEQAGLILATLDWVLDVQESETLYEATERDEYRALLHALLGVSDVPAAPEHQVQESDPSARPDLAAVRAEARALKAAVDARFTAIVRDGGDEDVLAARSLLTAVARDQTAREQSWFRMTGFPTEVDGDIRSVLTRTSSGSGVAAGAGA